MACPPSPRAALAMLMSILGPLPGCADELPAPVLYALEPVSGYNDRPQRVVLMGENFIPNYRLDPSTGSRIIDGAGFSGNVGEGEHAVPLTGFVWRSSTWLTATVPGGLPAGRHRVELIDPRGSRALVPGGYSSLGPDTFAPTVAFEAPPAEAITPGSTVTIRLAAKDDPGRVLQLALEARTDGEVAASHDCVIPVDARAVACPFAFKIPEGLPEGAAIDLQAVAVDEATPPNQAKAVLTLRVRAATP